MKLKTRSKLWIKSKMSQTMRRYWGARCRGVLFESENGMLLLPPSDLSISRTIAKEGVYNPGMLKVLRELMSQERDVLFVGTHVGAILIPSARWCRSVTGIEANPETFFLLEKNLQLNGVSNATLHNVAAMDADGPVRFAASRENTGGSKIFDGVPRRFEFVYDDPVMIDVPGRRLDDLLAGRTFDLVVMDIEGAEYRALQGMKNLLASTKELILEVLPNHVENVARVSPQEFLNTIPARFTHARPIDAPELAASYARAEFLAMYELIVKHRRLSGADILFVTE
jgi:FkbM family methyltransferase